MYDIVIVEDEELERQALHSILLENLDNVRIVGEARTGTEAIDLIENNDIDLMLVDINIPRPNGLDVIQRLRDKNANTKVIITTAYDYFDMMHTAIRLKADDYLLKPIRTPDLLMTVETCLQQLGTGRRSQEVVRRIGGLMEHDDYREGVAAVRRHVDWIYTRQDHAPRQLVLDFAADMAGLAAEKGLRIPEDLMAKVDGLQTMRLDGRSRLQVLAVFREMTDQLFDVARERFGQSPERLQKVLNYIERNLSKGVTLDEVAAYANVSPCYLSRLFKKTMNVNFITYLTGRRIDLAKELLTTSEQPITNIALELSYSDVNYFCKSFKKEVGLSPSHYRKQVREERAGL